MTEEADELRIEPPVPQEPPRSVGFLISQLGFFSSKGFMEALEPVGIGPREFLLMRFVERRADPEDRRVRGLYLTRKGRGVLERAGKIAIDYETRLCAGINRDEREQLIDLLQKLQASHTRLRGVHPGLGKD